MLKQALFCTVWGKATINYLVTTEPPLIDLVGGGWGIENSPWSCSAQIKRRNILKNYHGFDACSSYRHRQMSLLTMHELHLIIMSFQRHCGQQVTKKVNRAQLGFICLGEV